jgi:predicted membrane protein (TIGR00267 family)
VINADPGSFIFSFVIMAAVLFLLGVYLARISEDRIWKYSILMVSAGIITATFSFLLAS